MAYVLLRIINNEFVTSHPINDGAMNSNEVNEFLRNNVVSLSGRFSYKPTGACVDPSRRHYDPIHWLLGLCPRPHWENLPLRHQLVSARFARRPFSSFRLGPLTNFPKSVPVFDSMANKPNIKNKLNEN